MRPDSRPAVRQRAAHSQIHPRLSAELGKRLRTFAAGKGSSQNSVVQAALVKYLDDANDGTLIIRRLDRLSRAVGRVHRDVTVLADALAVYVQVWFAHTPRIPDSDKSAAERVALARFAQFTEHVAARVASGKSVMTDLAQGNDAPEDDDPTDATNDKEGAEA